MSVSFLGPGEMVGEEDCAHKRVAKEEHHDPLRFVGF